MQLEIQMKSILADAAPCLLQLPSLWVVRGETKGQIQDPVALEGAHGIADAHEQTDTFAARLWYLGHFWKSTMDGVQQPIFSVLNVCFCLWFKVVGEGL